MANRLYNKQVANPRVALKKGGFLKKVGKAAAGIGAAVLAAKGFRKKPAAKKKDTRDAVDKYFAKKGTSLKTGDASAAESMAKADRDKKMFRRGLDKIAKAGGVSKLKDGGSAMKPVDKNKNPGLAKLPTDVRNKMGFMKKGGRVGLQEGGSPGYKQGKMDVLFNRYEKNNQKIKELKKKLKSLKRVRKSIGKK